MRVNEVLVSYLKKKYKNIESITKILKDNSLYFLVANLFDIDVERQFYCKMNKLQYKTFTKRLLEIRALFSSANIEAILLKGVALAEKLYDPPHNRCIGDVDIFVKKEHFSDALILLIRTGYNFRNENTINDDHHIVLVRDGVTVELHKSIFNPILDLNETYLLGYYSQKNALYEKRNKVETEDSDNDN